MFFCSASQRPIKKGVVRSLINAHQLTDESFLEQELEHVKSVLLLNGYPKSVIKNVEKYFTANSTDSQHQISEPPTSTAVISYVPGCGGIVTWRNDFDTLAAGETAKLGCCHQSKVYSITTIKLLS